MGVRGRGLALWSCGGGEGGAEESDSVHSCASSTHELRSGVCVCVVASNTFLTQGHENTLSAAFVMLLIFCLH